MPEYTDDDVTRLADMIRGTEPSTFETCARRLLDQGVKMPPPPPDPAVVVAEAINGAWVDDESTQSVLRHLFPTDALEAAAAKVHEAES